MILEKYLHKGTTCGRINHENIMTTRSERSEDTPRNEIENNRTRRERENHLLRIMLREK